MSSSQQSVQGRENEQDANVNTNNDDHDDDMGIGLNTDDGNTVQPQGRPNVTRLATTVVITPMVNDVGGAQPTLPQTSGNDDDYTGERNLPFHDENRLFLRDDAVTRNQFGMRQVRAEDYKDNSNANANNNSSRPTRRNSNNNNNNNETENAMVSSSSASSRGFEDYPTADDIYVGRRMPYEERAKHDTIEEYMNLQLRTVDSGLGHPMNRSALPSSVAPANMRVQGTTSVMGDLGSQSMCRNVRGYEAFACGLAYDMRNIAEDLIENSANNVTRGMISGSDVSSSTGSGDTRQTSQGGLTPLMEGGSGGNNSDNNGNRSRRRSSLQSQSSVSSSNSSNSRNTGGSSGNSRRLSNTSNAPLLDSPLKCYITDALQRVKEAPAVVCGLIEFVLIFFF